MVTPTPSGFLVCCSSKRASVWLPLATLSALGFTGPIFVTLGAVLFLGEKVHGRRWAAVAIGFAGMLVIGLTLSVPVIYSRVLGQRAFFAVQGVASLGSVGLGLWMLYRLILSPDGL